MGEEGRKILKELGEGNSNQNTLDQKKGTFNKRKLEKKEQSKILLRLFFKEATWSYRVKQNDWSWGRSVKQVRHRRHMLRVLPHTCGHFQKSAGRYSSDFLTVNKVGVAGRVQLKFESSNVVR